RELRDDGPAVDAIAEPHQTPLAHQAAQYTQHLVLAAEIGEFTRQEHALARFTCDACLNPLPQCRSPRQLLRPLPKPLQKPDIQYRQKPDILQVQRVSQPVDSTGYSFECLPALPCPALPCPALPCPALPCP